MRQLHKPKTPPNNMQKNPFKAIVEIIQWYLIGCLDFLWNIIKSIWRVFIIGGIVAGIIGNAAYEYITKGHIEFDNIMSLPIVQLVETYPIFTVCLILYCPH